MKIVKIYLDDVRPCPEGYIYVQSAQDCIAKLSENFLLGNTIEHLTLDHDLGDDVFGTGYTVILWLEKYASDGVFIVNPDYITIHSANPVGRAKMQSGIDALKKMRNRT